MRIVVGLGNPGANYAKTRHNLGWFVLDELATRLGVGEWRIESSFECEIQEVRLDAERVLLVKPTTFMNNSGRAVATLARYYKVSADDILVLHDELDLPLGTVRLRLGGSAAGHHGIESIAHHLSSDQFWRLRCGIAAVQRAESGQGSTFVLSTFDASEQPLVAQVVESAATFVHNRLVSGILTEETIVIPSVGGSQ